MAKKNTRDTLSQPGLFDIFDDISLSLEPPLPIHPSIEDFVVESRKAGPSQEPPAHTNHLDEPVAVDSRPRQAILFRSFGSGSSGNCSFIGDRSGGILIDAGVDAKTVIDGLKDMGLTMADIHGICLTHDHGDHVRCVYSLVRRHNHIKVFCTPKAFSGIMRRHSISRRLKDYHQPIYKEFPFKIGPFEITAFEVSHDGTDNSGFFISRSDMSFAIATDLGCITDRVDFYMRQANFIVIESNYDAEMLANGPYPTYLKARIAADNGHLDNSDTAKYLALIRSPKLKNVFLCHLSRDNNTPSTALNTVAAALGITPGIAPEPGALRLEVLPRFDASPLYILRK
ncbi:MAG: MBL fold metallo-hydrolase [Muribaculaceae bacterium]|jgi:phosphoribosyl 1,2-cyclic phosphodiesterase|nr:MBL fold metallo-hydrolase [Muribaculaceae bacterium]